MPTIYPFKYARVQHTEEYFPLISVELRMNWNLEDEVKDIGEFQTIRLFHTESAAQLFADLINAALEGIQDVAE